MDIQPLETTDPRWKDLYRIGFFSCAAIPVLIVVFIAAYFVWPYTPGITSVAEIFATLQSDRFAGLITLDLAVPVTLPILVLQMLALYVALKPVNESYALIALVFGIIGVILWLTVRPIAEMATLSERYVAATSESARSQTLAAGETLSTLFNGTSWMLSQIFIPISYFISSLLMLRSKLFNKAEAYPGILLKPTGMGILIPGVGAAIGIVSTLGDVVWYIFLARAFFRLGWGNANG
ncbi:MAG: DUF4386 family protein [Chloroflexota bacterium]